MTSFARLSVRQSCHQALNDNRIIFWIDKDTCSTAGVFLFLPDVKWLYTGLIAREVRTAAAAFDNVEKMCYNKFYICKNNYLKEL